MNTLKNFAKLGQWNPVWAMLEVPCGRWVIAAPLDRTDRSHPINCLPHMDNRKGLDFELVDQRRA